MPMLGFIEAADTREETVKRIRKVEVRQGIEDKKMLRRLKRETPGKNIIKAYQYEDVLITGPRKGEFGLLLSFQDKKHIFYVSGISSRNIVV